MGKGTFTIKVDALARVEGEGGVLIKIRDGHVKEVKLNIYEPPRFFEALLRGRKFYETPDITARICGICPVAYQMSSINAMEQILGIELPEPIINLRKLLYYGEWIESHALHVFLLHAPDFFGYESAIEMAKDYRQLVSSGLFIKKIGNSILEKVGGRAVHPINVKVGGFYRVPTITELKELIEPLKIASELTIQAIKLIASIEYPEMNIDYPLVALTEPDEYAILSGKIKMSNGKTFSVHDFERMFREHQVKHSNALHSLTVSGENYQVGPIARYNLNFDKLTPLAREIAREIRLMPPMRNPFKSIIVRLIEILHAIDGGMSIIKSYEPPSVPYVEKDIVPGTGYGATEAPRGILYHRYTIDKKGLIRDAKIIPPTSQNLASMEKDLQSLVENNLELESDRLAERCEQVVRNFDPCISCATHSIKVKILREGYPNTK